MSEKTSEGAGHAGPPLVAIAKAPEERFDHTASKACQITRSPAHTPRDQTMRYATNPCAP